MNNNLRYLNPERDYFSSLSIDMLCICVVGVWPKFSTIQQSNTKDDSLTHQTDFALDNNLSLGRSNHGVLCVQPLLLRTAKLFLQQGQQRLLAVCVRAGLEKDFRTYTCMCTNKQTNTLMHTRLIGKLGKDGPFTRRPVVCVVPLVSLKHETNRR